MGYCLRDRLAVDDDNEDEEVEGLTRQETDACYNFFDPNGDGAVDYGEFSWAFYNRRASIKRHKEQLAAAKEAARVAAMKRAAEKKRQRRTQAMAQRHRAEGGLGLGPNDGGESSARDARLARRHEERRRARRQHTRSGA